MYQPFDKGGVPFAPAVPLAVKQALEAPDGVFDWLPIGIYTCDRDGVVLRYNRRAAELWGRAPTQGDPAVRFCGSWRAYRATGEPLPPEEAPMAEVLRTGLPVRDRELVIERPDGSRRTILANLDPLRDASGQIVGGVNCFQDITEHKRAQQALQDQDRCFRDLLEALPAAIYTTDGEGRITFYNGAAVALAGRRPELGKDEWCVTWRLYQPDGTPLPHDQCPMAVALKENRPVRGVDAILERPDGTRVPFIPYPTPLRDGEGRLVGAVNMLVDISERQRAEAALRELNETLERRVESEIGARLQAEQAFRQAQKMEVIGQLTGGVAHDFNNLLTAVMGNLDLVAGRAADPEIRKLAEGALRAAKRGATLTHQLLAFSRQQRLELKPANVNELVTGMGDMLLRTLGGTVRVELALSDGLWPALIDTNQIENAILNLAINARDAMPEGGTLTLETANLRVGQLNRPAGLDPGDYVVIAVADTGTGMSDEVKAKAFEPFFTTKEVGKGSGLGLSQVYGVARQSGGAVEIDSRPGCGTTVRLYLPRARLPLPHSLAEGGQRANASAHNGRRVLVVDDDDDVRQAVVALIERLGYAAAAAPSGAAALDRLETEAFDLALVDFAMPGMNGVEAGRVMRARWPELPILFMTGHADAPALGDEIAAGSILRKPFLAAELDAKIGRVLERQATLRGADNVVPLRAEGR